MNSTQNSYHIVLPCKRENDTDPVMKLENFTSALPEMFDFGDEDWEMALTEITYPKIWLTIPKDQKIEILKFKKNSNNLFEVISHPIAKIEEGDYTMDEIIDKVNARMKYLYEKVEDNLYIRNFNDKIVTMVPELSYLGVGSKKLRLKYGCLDNSERFFIRFDDILGNILGFGRHEASHLANYTFQKYKDLLDINPDHLFSKWEMIDRFQIAPRDYDINRNLKFFHVVCDSISDSYFANLKSQLLRVISIPDSAQYGDMITEIFENPYYYPIRTNMFDKINIKCLQNLPELGTEIFVPFTFGIIHIHLHLRRCNQFIKSIVLGKVPTISTENTISAVEQLDLVNANEPVKESINTTHPFQRFIKPLSNETINNDQLQKEPNKNEQTQNNE